MEGGSRFRKQAEEERRLVASTIQDIIQNAPSRFSKNGKVAEKTRPLGMCLQVQ
jgi:hypothetical protein